MSDADDVEGFINETLKPAILAAMGALQDKEVRMALAECARGLLVAFQDAGFSREEAMQLVLMQTGNMRK